MASIRKRGNRWQVRYWLNGRLCSESAATYKAARTIANDRERDKDKGLTILPAARNLTFDEGAYDFLTDYKVNGRKSYADAERIVRKHLHPAFGGHQTWTAIRKAVESGATAGTPVFGGRRLASITSADVKTYINARLEADAEPATVNRELAALKRIFSLAVNGGKLASRPHVALLAEHNVRKGFFERESFEAVRRHLPDALQPVATFAYFTGWRKREILPLEWRQVDLAAGTVRLDPGTTKNREGRTFVFADLPPLRELLKAQWTEHEALAATGVLCPVVFHRNGKPITSMDTAWRAACKAAGQPGRLLHDFRRTAVRNLVRAGVPERVAMTMTGHKTRSVFDRYDITSEADLRRAGALLAATWPEYGQSTPPARASRSDDPRK